MYRASEVFQRYFYSVVTLAVAVSVLLLVFGVV